MATKVSLEQGSRSIMWVHEGVYKYRYEPQSESGVDRVKTRSYNPGMDKNEKRRQIDGEHLAW